MKYLNTIINYMFRDIPIHIINMATMILPNHLIINKIRGFLMRPFFGKCGRGLQIGRGVIINNPQNIFFGNNCYISHYSYLQAKGKITLGDNVIIGPMSIVATSNHKRIDNKVTNIGVSKPIKIGNGSWCGGHVVITAGVELGDGSIVGAGAVVTKSFTNNKKIGGIPARIIS